MGFSIFDILREAEGDEQQDAGGNAPADAPPAEAPAEGDDTAGGEDEDNFDIDANLDEPDEGEGGDDENAPAADDDFGGGDAGGGGMDEPEDEPNEDNTDIFASLTAEEQQMKIMELKTQYQTLYVSCDDLLEKINGISVDEDSNEFVSKMTTTLFDLKRYIADYLVYTFADKSFVENDIMLNRFLAIINSMTNSFEKFQKKVNQIRGVDDKKDEEE